MSTKLKVKDELKDYLLLLAAQEPLDGPTEAALLADWQHGDEEAFRSLAEAYLPKVLSWVSPRRGQSRSFKQLLALGNAAMVQALRQYRGDAFALESKLAASVRESIDLELKK